VSDERESAAGDGDDTTTRGGQTAVVTRPLRPSGKRSRQIAEPVEAEPIERVGKTKGGVTKDGAPTKVKAAKKAERRRVNPITFVVNYLRQVLAELRKVIWPNRKQMVSYTSVVLVFLAFMVALIGVADLGLAKLVLMVFG
jgi:preprotein translocase subunit SecE